MRLDAAKLPHTLFCRAQQHVRHIDVVHRQHHIPCPPYANWPNLTRGINRDSSALIINLNPPEPERLALD